MTESSERRQQSSLKWILILLFGSFSLVFLSMILGLFDTTTELIPGHPFADKVCLFAAAVCGLLAFGLGIYSTKGLKLIQRIMLPVAFLFMSAVGVFLSASRVVDLAEGWADFPAGRSHTFTALIPISRAYRTHGKGASQYIQTKPIWSNLEVTQADFAFMRDHRRADDASGSPDEIKSQGYFCAKVMLEQSDKALRILHAGFEELPTGSVVLCRYAGPLGIR